MVEFAFSLVLVLILLAGAVDVGRAMFTYMALREAAQEGAVIATTTQDAPLTAAQLKTLIEQRVRNTSDQLPNTVQVNVTLGGVFCTGKNVTVQVVYEHFPLTMPFLGTFVGAQEVPISASVTDTILKPPCP